MVVWMQVTPSKRTGLGKKLLLSALASDNSVLRPPLSTPFEPTFWPKEGRASILHIERHKSGGTIPHYVILTFQRSGHACLWIFFCFWKERLPNAHSSHFGAVRSTLFNPASSHHRIDLLIIASATLNILSRAFEERPPHNKHQIIFAQDVERITIRLGVKLLFHQL